MDFALARSNMVKSQVAPNAVANADLLAGMMEVPRESFVDDAWRDFAYSDHPIPMDGNGRRFLKPLQSAWLLDALGTAPGARVLVVGAGTGYEAALLLSLGVRVYCLESDATLAAKGQELVSGENVSWKNGPLAEGWPEESPFDGIVLCGAVEEVSNKLIGQLGKNGRLTAIVGAPGAPVMQGVRMVGIAGGDAPENLFETVAHPLPGFTPPERFVL